MDLEKVAADSKRIAEKLRETQELAEQSKSHNKSPAPGSVPGEQSDNDRETDRVLCGWREDEDDRYSVKDYSFPYHRQNHMCDDNPEIMKAILLTFFKADHDAAQFEQYQLENGLSQPAEVRNAVTHLKSFISSGLRVLLTVVFIMGAGSAKLKAQDLKTPQALKIGDKVPDITIQKIINYPISTAKISDFKGKLLILDFWASWCSPCVSMIPKVDSLQKQFAGTVQFLPVTYQDEKLITALRKKLKQQRGIEISGNPEVVADKTLSKLFPHQTLPHIVWISGEGRVLAITGYEDVTDANIRKMSAGSSTALAEKKDPKALRYNKGVPILLAGNGGDGMTMVSHSLLMSYTEGLPPGYSVNSHSYGFKITARNISLLKIFKLAWGGNRHHLGHNTVSLEVKDPDRVTFYGNSGDFTDWKKEGNGWCYELAVPAARAAETFDMMQQDMQRYFPQYRVQEEKRKTKCLVLERTSSDDKLRSKGGKSSSSFSGTGAVIRNNSLDLLVLQLNAVYLQKSRMPVINETGYTTPVDLDLNAGLSDVSAMNAALATYGLRFTEAEREINILVIRDAPEKN